MKLLSDRNRGGSVTDICWSIVDGEGRTDHRALLSRRSRRCWGREHACSARDQWERGRRRETRKLQWPVTFQ